MYTSLMNPQVSLTLEKWGVTLTADKNSYHARIVIEGVQEKDNNFEHFYTVAHLMGPSGCNPIQGCFSGKSYNGIVAISEKTDAQKFKTKYSKKTETWLIFKEKVENLIDEIKSEVGQNIPFNICGGRSIFSKPAEIFEIYDPLLVAIKKENEYLFLCLFDSAENGGECTRMSQQDFDEAISETLKAINVTKEYTYSDLIKMVKAFVEKKNDQQNNCFTWARSKLEKLGIKLCDYKLECIISVTTLYAIYGPNSKIEPFEIDYNEREPILQKHREEALHERFVTYQVKRDKRTEDWKILQKRMNASYLAGGSALVAGGVATFCCVSMLPVAPIGLVIAIAGPILTVKILNKAIGCIASDQKQLRSQKFDLRFNQPGNENWKAL